MINISNNTDLFAAYEGAKNSIKPTLFRFSDDICFNGGGSATPPLESYFEDNKLYNEYSQIVQIIGLNRFKEAIEKNILISNGAGEYEKNQKFIKKNEIQSEPPPQINEQKSCIGGTISSCYTNSLDAKGVGDFPISDIVGRIKSPKYKTVTEKLRSYSIGSEEASDYKKKNFVAVTFSGTFAPSRAKANLQAHTGLLCLDFDKLHLESFEATKAKIQADLHTYICFVSPSGNGLKVVVKLTDCQDEKTHLQYFLQLEKYYLETFGLQIDKACKNVDRLCFLPYDENLYINEGAKEFCLQPEQSEPKETRQKTAIHATETNVFEWCLEQILKSETFTKGNRNRFVNRLAWYCNEKGVDLETCLNECLNRFVESDFSNDEIEATIKSIYTNHKDKFNSSPYEVRAKKENVNHVVSEIAKKLNPLLSQFLEKVQVVIFFDLAGIKYDKEKGKYERSLTIKDYVVLSIEEVLNLAKVQKWNLSTKYNNIYLYTGTYWQVIDEKDFGYFLQKCAEKMSVPIITAKHYEFAEKLLKQFLSSAYLPTPPQNETVLINLQNGTFEISEKETKLRPFEADDFLTYILPFEYDAQARCPLFQKYLDKVLPEQSLQNILAEFVGYVFTKNLKLEKALFLLGSGSNGKSVFYEVVNALIGSNNTANYSIKSLTGQNNQYYLANLPKYLLNYASEFKEIQDFDIFKKLVSCEDTEARKPYGEPFTFRNQCKMILNSNGMPKDIEQNEAYFRRLLIIPFEVEIQDHEKDVDLPTKIIKNELSGVFNWVLEGLQRVLENRNFTQSEKVKQTVQDYKNSSDSVHTFLDEKGYIPSKNTKDFKTLQEIYIEYRSFCLEVGSKPLQRGNFRERLEKKHKVLIGERKSEGVPVYLVIPQI